VLVVLTGCASSAPPKQNFATTGDPVIDGENAMNQAPEKDRVLWQYRTGLAALRRGNFAEAQRMFEDALTRVGGIIGPDKSGKQARSLFSEEAKKTFIGEPYERVMAYFYRGVLYWMNGEPDNARACFRNAQFQDSDTENREYANDWILMDYLDQNLYEILHNKVSYASEEEHLKALVMKTSRLSFTACNEFIGWDFVRENANSQEFLKHLSDQLEALLLSAYLQLDNFKNNPARREGLAFLLKASKSIVFSFAFTSVSDSDVRKNFVSFQKEILPFLVKAAL